MTDPTSRHNIRFDAPTKPQDKLPRAEFSTMQGTKSVVTKTLKTFTAKIGACLEMVSKMKISLQTRFTPGAPQRVVKKASFSEGAKAANRALKNPSHNEEMGRTIGKHRQK